MAEEHTMKTGTTSATAATESSVLTTLNTTTGTVTGGTSDEAQQRQQNSHSSENDTTTTTATTTGGTASTSPTHDEDDDTGVGDDDDTSDYDSDYDGGGTGSESLSDSLTIAAATGDPLGEEESCLEQELIATLDMISGLHHHRNRPLSARHRRLKVMEAAAVDARLGAIALERKKKRTTMTSTTQQRRTSHQQQAEKEKEKEKETEQEKEDQEKEEGDEYEEEAQRVMVLVYGGGSSSRGGGGREKTVEVTEERGDGDGEGDVAIKKIADAIYSAAPNQPPSSVAAPLLPAASLSSQQSRFPPPVGSTPSSSNNNSSSSNSNRSSNVYTLIYCSRRTTRRRRTASTTASTTTTTSTGVMSDADATATAGITVEGPPIYKNDAYYRSRSNHYYSLLGGDGGVDGNGLVEEEGMGVGRSGQEEGGSNTAAGEAKAEEKQQAEEGEGEGNREHDDEGQIRSKEEDGSITQTFPSFATAEHKQYLAVLAADHDDGDHGGGGTREREGENGTEPGGRYGSRSSRAGAGAGGELAAAAARWSLHNSEQYGGRVASFLLVTEQYFFGIIEGMDEGDGEHGDDSSDRNGDGGGKSGEKEKDKTGCSSDWDRDGGIGMENNKPKNKRMSGKELVLELYRDKVKGGGRGRDGSRRWHDPETCVVLREGYTTTSTDTSTTTSVSTCASTTTPSTTPSTTTSTSTSSSSATATTIASTSPSLLVSGLRLGVLSDPTLSAALDDAMTFTLLCSRFCPQQAVDVSVRGGHPLEPSVLGWDGNGYRNGDEDDWEELEEREGDGGHQNAITTAIAMATNTNTAGCDRSKENNESKHKHPTYYTQSKVTAMAAQTQQTVVEALPPSPQSSSYGKTRHKNRTELESKTTDDDSDGKQDKNEEAKGGGNENSRNTKAGKSKKEHKERNRTTKRRPPKVKKPPSSLHPTTILTVQLDALLSADINVYYGNGQQQQQHTGSSAFLKTKTNTTANYSIEELEDENSADVDVDEATTTTTTGDDGVTHSEHYKHSSSSSNAAEVLFPHFPYQLEMLHRNGNGGAPHNSRTYSSSNPYCPPYYSHSPMDVIAIEAIVSQAVLYTYTQYSQDESGGDGTRIIPHPITIEHFGERMSVAFPSECISTEAVVRCAALVLHSVTEYYKRTYGYSYSYYKSHGGNGVEGEESKEVQKEKAEIILEEEEKEAGQQQQQEELLSKGEEEDTDFSLLTFPTWWWDRSSSISSPYISSIDTPPIVVGITQGHIHPVNTPHLVVVGSRGYGNSSSSSWCCISEGITLCELAMRYRYPLLLSAEVGQRCLSQTADGPTDVYTVPISQYSFFSIQWLSHCRLPPPPYGVGVVSRSGEMEAAGGDDSGGGGLERGRGRSAAAPGNNNTTTSVIDEIGDTISAKSNNRKKTQKKADSHAVLPPLPAVHYHEVTDSVVNPNQTYASAFYNAYPRQLVVLKEGGRGGSSGRGGENDDDDDGIDNSEDPTTVISPTAKIVKSYKKSSTAKAKATTTFASGGAAAVAAGYHHPSPASAVGLGLSSQHGEGEVMRRFRIVDEDQPLFDPIAGYQARHCLNHHPHRGVGLD